MRVAIIGSGLQGNRRAQALESFPDADLVVVTAKGPSGAEPLAKRMRCAAGAGWEEVVRRTDVDVVVVCTPPNLQWRTNDGAGNSRRRSFPLVPGRDQGRYRDRRNPLLADQAPGRQCFCYLPRRQRRARVVALESHSVEEPLLFPSVWRRRLPGG